MKLTAQRIVVLLVSLSLVGAACGARLNRAQVQSLEGSSANAAAAGSGAGVATGLGSGQATSGTGTSATGATGATAGSTGNSVAGRSSTGAGAGSSNAVSSSSGTGGSGTSSRGSAGASNSGASTGASSTAAVPGLSVDPSVCSGPASGPGITSSTVTVGNVSTITGPIPGLTVGSIYGTNAFASYINSNGGICGRRLVVKAADDDVDPSQNATATQSLVGSVFAMVGSYSGVDDGGAPALQSSGIPDIGEALSPQRFDLPNNFSPEPLPPNNFLTTAPFLYMAHQYPTAVKHFALLIENQTTAVAESLPYERVAEAAGFKFVYIDSNIAPTQTDFSADAQEMKSHGVQGFFFLAVASIYADLATALEQIGYTMPLAAYSETAYDPAFIQQAGSAANGAEVFSQYAMYDGEDAATTPTIALFDKWYEALYGSPPDEFAADGWLSGMLFVDGLNLGGGLTRSDLLAGLSKVTSFDGGGIESPADPAGKKPGDCYVIIEVKNQKFVRAPGMPSSGFDCQYT